MTADTKAPFEPSILQTETPQEFENVAVELLKQKMRAAIADHSVCILGLSGGSTPQPIYEALSKEDLPWEKVWIFLADERFIEPTHADSNQKMIRDTFLQSAHIPENQCIFPNTTLTLEKCVETYTKDLKQMLNVLGRLPDIVTLGMGPDGHIASLFPSVPDLALGDEALVIHTTTDQFAVHDRLSVSLNFLCSAEERVFFLKGAEKKSVWEEMVASTEDEHRWPAKRLLETGPVDIVAYW